MPSKRIKIKPRIEHGNPRLKLDVFANDRLTRTIYKYAGGELDEVNRHRTAKARGKERIRILAFIKGYRNPSLRDDLNYSQHNHEVYGKSYGKVIRKPEDLWGRRSAGKKLRTLQGLKGGEVHKIQSRRAPLKVVEEALRKGRGYPPYFRKVRKAGKKISRNDIF